MKLLLSAAVLFLVLAQVFCEEFGAKEDPDYWTNSIQIQVTIFTLSHIKWLYSIDLKCFFIVKMIIVLIISSCLV